MRCRTFAGGTTGCPPSRGPTSRTLVKIGADGEASVWRYDREKNELVACG
jgi:hypothetical protein